MGKTKKVGSQALTPRSAGTSQCQIGKSPARIGESPCRVGESPRRGIEWSESALKEIRSRIAVTQKAAKTADSAPPQIAKTPSDDDIFREAMSGVHEFSEFRSLEHRALKRQPRPCPVDFSGEDLDAELHSFIDGRSRIDISQTSEYVQWHARDVSPDFCRDLHTGRIPAQDSLDLHGFTLDDARPALETFVRDAVRRGLRCVNIVHGRGLRSPLGPVLKENIRRWISFGPLGKIVMAYATAPSADGGAGATYLLLR